MKSWAVDVTDHHETSVEDLVSHDRMAKISLGQPLVWFKIFRQASSQEPDTLVMRLPHCLHDASTRAALVANLQSLEYWKQYFQGSTATQIVAKPGPRFQHGRQDTVSQDVVVPSLTEHGITIATVVKAAWGFVLADLCGQEDVTFGELVGGRGLPVAGIETLDAMAASTIPSRLQLNRSWKVIDFLRDIQERHLASMPFESVGTASIVEHCTSWPRWTRFGSVLNHSALPLAEDADSGALQATGIQGHMNPGSDLNIQTHPVRNDLGSETSLLVEMGFGVDYIAPAFVSAILDRYCSTIRSFTTNLAAALDGMRQDLIGGRMLPLPFSNGPIKSWEMRPLDAAEHEQLLGMVQSVWNKVIGESKGMDTPFLSSWGSLIAAANFVDAYGEFGVDLTMEEVPEAPTMRVHVVLCAGRIF
ncbi:Nonribosomal peptide synthase nlsA-like protein [Cladobotryum mycophilum]|uniref:Nonribosomal peptide synthase nlsA-like protein n=1 Tax=Cladobotryum mycophilum TaxID=491253 RepID=A0ABR0SWQ4_9HYPO